ncbi:MAG: hypothetical protein HY080_13465 [Gammaproteobacteria bacterium]|nr:hypothetical protein [Gammaproteobacteria bacterium]
MEDHRILVGASDWQHPQWQQEFYPADLPPEWRLGFYSNEFRVVLLPMCYWPDDPRSADRYLDQAGGTLVFILELPATACQSAYLAHTLEVLSRFGQQLLGVAIPASGVMTDPAAVLTLATLYRVCVANTATEGTVLNPSAALAAQLSYCWDGVGDSAVLRRGRLAIARIQSKDMDLHALRRVLQALLGAQDPQRYLAVIFEGTPPALKLMRQALTMLDLI